MENQKKIKEKETKEAFEDIQDINNKGKLILIFKILN